MASNPTPENNDILRALADRIADGCHTYEAAIGILQNTEARIRAAITALAQAELMVGLKKQGVDDAFTAVHAADAAGEVRLTNCKLRLAQKLGQRWSAAWEPTGFPDQSTAVPDTMDARFTLLDSLKNYFHVVPANESADMGATEALCLAAWTAISDARQGLANAGTAQTDAFDARTAAEDGLRKRVRGLIDELGELIPDDDSRYESFGLSIPANPSAPETIASLTLAALGGAKVFAQWPYSARMVGTRLMLKRIGVDTEFASIGTVAGLEKMLTNQTPNQTIEIFAIAYNDGGDAPPSPTVSVVVS